MTDALGGVIAHDEPDVVGMDLLMPRMMGLEAIEVLQRQLAP